MSLYEHLVAMPEEKRLNTLENLPTYLAEMGQAERLQTILTTYDFLKAKVDAIGVEQLIADYELTTDAEAQLIQSTLKSCAHILRRDKGTHGRSNKNPGRDTRNVLVLLMGWHGYRVGYKQK